MRISTRDACPECGPCNARRTAIFPTGSRITAARACGRQFASDATKRVIAAEHRTVVERLLCEKISLHGICRAIGVSIRWLLDFMTACFAALPEHLNIPPVASSREVLLGCLEVEANELWSFVQKKANGQWLWLAMDKQTRQIIAFHVGDRSRNSAKQVWQNLPTVYREQATFSTDQYTAYRGVMPVARHRAITTLARQTNHSERFDNTLRQRVSRLVRSTLAFSKKVENHLGAIRYFICRYHLTRATLLV